MSEDNTSAEALRDRLENLSPDDMTDAEMICTAVFELGDTLAESTDILSQVVEDFFSVFVKEVK